MADVKLETLEPDPAATSISNDETVNKPAESTTQADTAVKSEDQDVSTTADETAKYAKVETEGLVTNGDEKQGNAQVKTEESDSIGDKKRKADSAESPQKRKRYDDDPNNKYRTYGNRDRGNRFDPNVKKETDDPAEIRKQVDFYFSEGNLARDDFLYGKVEGPKNKPVDLATICSFKRMRRFQPFEAVVKALKDSTVINVLEEDTDTVKIQRKTPISKDFENKSSTERTQIAEEQTMARSVYAKGFGLEEPSTQFDLEAFFSRFGDVDSVRLRRADDRSFKGSVFVEFGNVDTAQKFLDLDPKPTFNDRELLIKSKKEYCDEKIQLIKDGKIEPKKHHGSKRSDDRDWRARRDEDSKNGFRDNRGGRGGRGRGRGGNDRGRGGRGGRGGNRGDRRGGGRDNDRNAEREAKAKAEAASTDDGSKEAPKADAAASDAAPSKRAREDDGGEQRESKKEKLDTEA